MISDFLLKIAERLVASKVSEKFKLNSKDEYRIYFDQKIFEFIKGYKLVHHQSNDIGKIHFYESREIIEELLKLSLLSEQVDLDKIKLLLSENENVLLPTESELTSFTASLINYIKDDHVLRELEVNGNYKSEIFNISKELSVLQEKINASTAVEFRKLSRISKIAEQEISFIENIHDEGHSQSVFLENVYVKRDLESDIQSAISGNYSSQLIIVAGEAGFGKSSLLWCLNKTLKSQSGTSAFLLKSSQLKNINLELAITFLKNIASSENIIVLIDTVDLLLHSDNDRDMLVENLLLLKSMNVNTIITSRPQEIANLLPFKRELRYEVKQLKNYHDETELPNAIWRYTEVYAVNRSKREKEGIFNHMLQVASNSKSLIDLCRTPLTLRMLFSLYSPENPPREINVFQLYKSFWDLKVERDVRIGINIDNKGKEDNLGKISSKIALIMLIYGELELSYNQREMLLREKGIENIEIEILVNRGILKRNLETESIEFFHQTFFEHAAARGLLYYGKLDGLQLLRAKLFTDDNSSTNDKLFISPILEHLLLLAETSDISSEAINITKELIESGDFLLIGSGLYVYLLLNHPGSSLEFVVANLLQSVPKGDAWYIKRFLEISPSIPLKRIYPLFTELELIWKRNSWAEQYQILTALEHIVGFAAKMTIDFLKTEDKIQVIIDQSAKGEVAMHSDSLKILFRILIKLTLTDFDYAIHEINRIVYRAKTNDLTYLYRMDHLKGSTSFKIREIVVTKYSGKYGATTNSKKEIPKEVADEFGNYWMDVWKKNNSSLPEILVEIQKDKSSVVLQGKLAGLAKLCVTLDETGSVMVLDAFKRTKDTYIMIRWGKWFFSRLVDGTYTNANFSFLKIWQTELNKILSGKDDSTSPIITHIYEDAFTNSVNPNKHFFLTLEKGYFNPTAWNTHPHWADIFISAYLSDFAPAAQRVLQMIEEEEVNIEVRVSKRLFGNFISKSMYSTTMLEYLILVLIKTKSFSSLNAVLDRNFNSRVERKKARRSWVNKHNISTKLEHAIHAELIEEENPNRELIARLWAICIKGELLANPSLKEVLKLFSKGKNNDDVIKDILPLLPLCSISTKQDLDEVLSVAQMALVKPNLKLTTQKHMLLLFSNVDFDLSNHKTQIQSLLLDEIEKDTSGDKIKYLNKIVIKQLSLKSGCATELLSDFFQTAYLSSIEKKKRDEIAHFFKGSILNLFLHGTLKERTQIAELIEKIDQSFARIIIDGISLHRAQLNTFSYVLERLLRSENVSAGVKDMLSKRLRTKTSAVQPWHEVEALI